MQITSASLGWACPGKAEAAIAVSHDPFAAAGGGLLCLPRLIPQRIAVEMALTGDMVGAERLYACGLVNELTEPGGALDAAHALARRILANAPLSLTASKRVIVEQADWSLEEMWVRQAAITGPVLASKDAWEGASAFAEKRPPQWTAE